MELLEIKGRKIMVDANGYLADQNDWNEDVATLLAEQEGVGALSPEQMDIIRFMREYYLKYRVFPMLNNICRLSHQTKECVPRQFVNPEKAWKIAGLPKQEGVHFVSMDGEHFFMESYC
ncbi:MAG: TusE/DsrC/DsvC family sulfur relay protein [Desulfobulbus sp.]|jgi:tRNA 2-thiouridine synthesizing protein E|uniref:TusE/DsrC/DsvC family sulfur relay protein n=1 Tax=Desulfobulbus sp. TaxID=895 RepID=UPI00283F1D77|nr:TusE/DsrC/DsvC family sulfur relay protein [Desulfobulbus sp.]MDR2548690.1 TusE/DsrC/DsvC family sulfur relay protein [Desulfobulbus sp.]